MQKSTNTTEGQMNVCMNRKVKTMWSGEGMGVEEG